MNPFGIGAAWGAPCPDPRQQRFHQRPQLTLTNSSMRVVIVPDPVRPPPKERNDVLAPASDFERSDTGIPGIRSIGDRVAQDTWREERCGRPSTSGGVSTGLGVDGGVAALRASTVCSDWR